MTSILLTKDRIRLRRIAGTFICGSRGQYLHAVRFGVTPCRTSWTNYRSNGEFSKLFTPCYKKYAALLGNHQACSKGCMRKLHMFWGPPFWETDTQSWLRTSARSTVWVDAIRCSIHAPSMSRSTSPRKKPDFILCVPKMCETTRRRIWCHPEWVLSGSLKPPCGALQDVLRECRKLTVNWSCQTSLQGARHILLQVGRRPWT